MLTSAHRAVGIGVALLVPTVAVALTIPNTFNSGEPLSSADLNENFNAVRLEVESLEARVEELGAELAVVQAKPTLAVGETVRIGEVPLETSRQYEVLSDGIFMTRPGGSGEIQTLMTDVRICSAAGTDSCEFGPRAWAGGDALTFVARAGDFVDFIVTGGTNTNSVGIYWTPLTLEGQAPPVALE